MEPRIMVSPVKSLVELLGFPLYENKKAVVVEGEGGGGEVVTVVSALSVTGLVIHPTGLPVTVFADVLIVTVQLWPFLIADR